AAQDMVSELDELLQDSRLLGMLPLSVTIIDAESGSVLAAHNDTRPMIPASNMKLLTSGVALDVFGPEFTFETMLTIAPDRGSIAIVGSGDPAFGDPELLREMDMGVEEFIDVWVQALANEDLPSAIEVVVDDRIFDREFVHPTWPEGQLNRRYCAEVAGLNFHTNVVSIYARPNAPGSVPTITVEPKAPWLEISNRAVSVGKGKQHTAWAARAYQTNAISLRGDVRYATSPVQVTLHDMPDFFAHLIADRLERDRDRTVSHRPADLDEDFEGFRTLHAVRTPLATVLERCNVDSSNLYAESLLKRLGHEITGAPGSWNNGAAVVRMKLVERLDAAAGSEIIVADGSGMSRQNRVTTGIMAQWLRSMLNDDRIGEVFFESLPVAGNEGTLQKRFRGKRLGNHVRAKTGYLSGVSALSGIVRHPETGRAVIFSIISNEKPNNVPLSKVRTLEEKIVLAIDGWLSDEVARR
ncbi:MAG: D-alanyl-D-alanine carboxypeptidase/D-alanyl-D-alanine-endopeptidase, partial [Planctomycetota bacterium]